MNKEQQINRVLNRLKRSGTWLSKCKLYFWFGDDGDYISGYDDGAEFINNNEEQNA